MREIICSGLIGFLCCLIIQVIIWKIFLVKKEIATLGVIFFILPIILYLSLYLINEIPFIDIVMIALLNLSISSLYMQTYPALREDIPSIQLLFFIKNNPELKRDEIINHFLKTNNFIKSIKKDLINDGLIKKDDPKCLTLTGKALVKFFYYYRKFLGIKRAHG